MLPLGMAAGPTDIIWRLSNPSIIGLRDAKGRTDSGIERVCFDIWPLL
jgi:hypothetical protein